MREEQVEDVLYILDFACSLAALSLVVFSLYVTPYLFFGASYDVPTFVVELGAWFQQHHDFQGWLLLLVFFLPIVAAVVVFALMGKWITALIDHKHGIDAPHMYQAAHDVEIPADILDKQVKKISPRKPHMILFIIGMMVTVVALLFLIEYLIFVDLVGG